MKHPASNPQPDIWDVVVIGGGPAGMMAAATAAAHGATVLLLEKNATLGKKLLITGGGRCNVTNNRPDVRQMLAAYAEEGKYLFSTFTQHGVTDTINWFATRGVPFIEENEGRLFPETESAKTIFETLFTELKSQNVTIASDQAVTNIDFAADRTLFTIQTKSDAVHARACIIATGGYARPDTGSTGDGFAWLQQLGHTIHAPSDALVPVTLATTWAKELSGLTLPEVTVSVWANHTKQLTRTGRVLFTHQGLSGPLILNMSKTIGDLLQEGEVEIRINLFPHHDAGALKAHLAALLASNKKLVNALAEQLPRQLARTILIELNIDGETPCHSVTKDARAKLLTYLQAVPLPVAGLLDKHKAIISSGGVDLDEIDFKTMGSRMSPQLYIVGDLLNINRPSGGYSLQLCWSTGYVAGKHATATE